MSWGSIAGAAVGLIGGASAAKSAKKAGQQQADAARQASDTQLTAARESNQLMADMYRQGMQNQAPGLQGGQVALSALMSGLGLGGARAGGGQPGAPRAPVGSFVNAQGQAVDAEGNPITQGVNNYGIGDTNYGATQADLDAGAASLPAGRFTETFKGDDIYMDPSYQFRLSEGERLLRARQGAGGNRFSGQALKDITNYGQQAASQEYGAANERFLKNQGLLFDRLSGLAGVGQQAANTASNSGQSAASAMGQNTMRGAVGASDYLTSGASAQARGNMGATNAMIGGANQAASNLYRMSFLNPQTPATTGGYGGLYDIIPGQRDGG